MSEKLDRISVDPDTIPSDLIYQWKREVTLGRREKKYQRRLRKAGWSAVPADRHPQLANAGETVIRYGGLILMQHSKIERL